MDVKINLLPEELKPKPIISMRALCLVLVVLALGYGCYHFYQVKAASEAEAAEVESRIEAIQSEMASLTSNPEARELLGEISEAQQEIAGLEALVDDYEAWSASRIEWGEVVRTIVDWIPSGVTIDAISDSSGDTVEVGGAATSYERAAAYASALENDQLFSNVSVTQWGAQDKTFLLILNVVPGGGS
jgi:Tfp pilus assembly protein PilN